MGVTKLSPYTWVAVSFGVLGAIECIVWFAHIKYKSKQGSLWLLIYFFNPYIKTESQSDDYEFVSEEVYEPDPENIVRLDYLGIKNGIESQAG